jgi:hypothetical protein
LTIGQILDRIFRLLRVNLRLFVEVASVPAGALCILYAVIGAALFATGVLSQPPHAPDPQKVLWVVLPSTLLGMAGFLLVYAVFEAAASYAALQANHGIKVSFREAYRIAWGSAGRFCWLMILRSLMIMLPTVLCFALIGGMVAASRTMGSHPGML